MLFIMKYLSEKNVRCVCAEGFEVASESEWEMETERTVVVGALRGSSYLRRAAMAPHRPPDPPHPASVPNLGHRAISREMAQVHGKRCEVRAR